MRTPTSNYWAFYWPLALMGMIRILSLQFQNGILGHYPEATQQLANLAIATGLFSFFHASLIFLPEMANVFSRSVRGRVGIFQFACVISSILTLPLAYLTLFPSGGQLMGIVFNLEPAAIREIQQYFTWLLPLILVDGMRHYYTGLLVQVGRTKTISVLNVVLLSVSIIALFGGFSLGWPAMTTMGVSQLASHVAVFIPTWWACRRYYQLPQKQDQRATGWPEMWRFYWPVALTGVLFAVTHPIIFGFISRQSNAIDILATLRVSFGFSLLFLVPVNAFRALFVTFSMDDAAGLQRFMFKTICWITGLMLFFSITPLSSWTFSELMGLQPDIVQRTRQSMLVMCLVPMAMALRNYYHGLAMINRTTGRMGVGGALRIGMITVACALLSSIHRLDHITASLVLFLGFVVEALWNAGYSWLASRVDNRVD